MRRPWVNGRELWQSDGTAAGTFMVRDIYAGATGSDPAYLVAMNNKLYFAATDPDHGRELWDPPAVEPPGDRMTLVGNWHEHHHLYGDVGGQRIKSGPYRGDYAYLGHFANQGGIDIINVTDPAHPVLASTFLGTGGDNELQDVQVENNIGYFASSTDITGGIYIADVSNPNHPVQLARIDPSNGGFRRVHTLFVDGAYLYEVHPKNDFPEIRVFNISDPAHPTFVRSIPDPLGQGIHEVTVRNGRLFTASFHDPDHVDIFDVSRVGDLSRPVPLLGIIHSGDVTHTALATEDGRFVVVTSEFAGHPLKIYDISNPARPTLASTINVPRSQAYTAHQPAIVGNLLYVAWFEAGVRVYDIANPYKPVLLGSYDTYTGPYGEEGECAVTPHGVNSDSDPFPLGCGAWGVYPFFGNDKILVSDFDHGLFVVSLDGRLTAPSTPAHAVNETLSIGQVQPLLAEAIHRWQSAGVDTSALHGIDIRIADLGGRTLGLASGHTIWLDDNAAGWGWFVDPTPGNDSEFTTPGDQGEQHCMDLLTVLEHELGHVLGFEHQETGVMEDTLTTGTRRVPSDGIDTATRDSTAETSAWPFSTRTGKRFGQEAAALARNTIADDEPRISISDVTKAEGTKGQTTLFTFTITLSAAYDQAVTMSYRTAKTSDSDYVARTGTLTFAPGETTKTITIEVKGDSKREADEYFYLDLFGNGGNSLFAKNRGLGTIQNDD